MSATAVHTAMTGRHRTPGRRGEHARRAEALVQSDRLLGLARTGLREGAATEIPAERYVAAHLAALRAAAAVLAVRACPTSSGRRGSRPASAWSLLVAVAPELGEWAQFFAAGASKRQIAQAGVVSAVTGREADDLLRDAETFLAVVLTTLGTG